MWWWLPGCAGIGGGGSAPVVVAPVEVPRAEVAAGDGAVPSLGDVRAAVAETLDPTLSSWMALPAFVMPVDADHPQLGQVPGFALFWVSPALDHPASFVVARRARDGALVVPDRNASGIAALVAEAPAWYRTDHGVEVLTALAARGGRVVWDPARLRSADDAPLPPPGGSPSVGEESLVPEPSTPLGGTPHFAPKVGHAFTMQTKPRPGFDGVVRCEVLELEAPRVTVW